MDTQRSVYNLDHHEGCVRPFTLATCEQAMVLIAKGLDLTAEPWHVYANEPDLDTVLAIWLLLNHRRLEGENDAVRRRIMPVVRLQGVIDSHGLDLLELSALPPELESETLKTIQGLRTGELALKEEGGWAVSDPLEFTIASLQEIDELVYTPDDFAGFKNVEELARIPITSDRFAIICRTDVGIYELEQHLRDVHGDRIGVILLEKSPDVYTLRQVDPFLPTSLDALYERLNFIDAAVTSNDRWGGSSDIGGSPRGSGTALDVSRLAAVVRWVYHPPSIGRRLGSVAVAVGLWVGVMATGVVAAVGGLPDHGPPEILAGEGWQSCALGIGVIALIGITLNTLAWRWRPGHFGFRSPDGPGWLRLLPVTLIGALAGGALVLLSGSGSVAQIGRPDWWLAAVVVFSAVGVECLFRGVVHGAVATTFPVFARGIRVISVPNIAASLLYTVTIVTMLTPPPWLSPEWQAAAVWSVWISGCLALSLACGIARERWGSVWAAASLHAAAAVILWWTAPLLT
jgi:hypothetical protein